MSKAGFAKDHLQSFVSRIERLLEERDALNADIREVYSEAKGSEFDTRIMRQVVALRKLDKADLQEREALLDLYKSALGMLSDTPLGEAAVKSAAKPSTKMPAALRSAAKEFTDVVGKPVEPTPEEKEKGVIVAFEKEGSRMSIGVAPPKSDLPDIPECLRRTVNA